MVRDTRKKADMKYALVLAIHLGAWATARAEVTTKYWVGNREVTKLEAMYTAATQPKLEVWKCQLQEVNEKGSGIRGKRTPRNSGWPGWPVANPLSTIPSPYILSIPTTLYIPKLKR